LIDGAAERQHTLVVDDSSVNVTVSSAARRLANSTVDVGAMMRRSSSSVVSRRAAPSACLVLVGQAGYDAAASAYSIETAHWPQLPSVVIARSGQGGGDATSGSDAARFLLDSIRFEAAPFDVTPAGQLSRVGRAALVELVRQLRSIDAASRVYMPRTTFVGMCAWLNQRAC
jgi:hypothetical protein